MGTTKRGSTLSVTERLRRVFLPCSPPTGDRSVTLKIFDKHELLSEMMPPQEMVAAMQNFLNGLAASPGLPADVASNLASIRFVVSYAARSPDAAEIARFAVTDYPIYLLTASGQVASSGQDIVDLLVTHQIPQQTQLVATLSPLTLAGVLPYKTVEEDWGSNPQVLGIGIPGRYFLPNSQTRCRKIAIIKMQGFMTENLPMGRRPDKILFVLRHELGHTLALRHQDGTLMDGSYSLNAATTYTNAQLQIISRALQLLIEG